MKINTDQRSPSTHSAPRRSAALGAFGAGLASFGLLAAIGAGGCAVGTTPDVFDVPDAPAVDASKPKKDSGVAAIDSGEADAGTPTPTPDSGTPITDSGTDAGLMEASVADSGVDSSVQDAGADSGRDSGADSGVVLGPVVTGTCNTSVINYAALKATVPNSRVGTLNSCSAADIATARVRIQNAMTLNDLDALFTGTCKACATERFNAGENGTERPWAAFNFFYDMNNTIVGYILNNDGACIATRSNPANPVCGRVLATENPCTNQACSSCVSDATRAACETRVRNANTGTCGIQVGADLRASCTANDIALFATGNVCGARAADVTNGDVYITSVAGACGAP
jgi:hypothetical protein